MTTVAYKDGWLAADTRVTVSNQIEPGHYTKMYRLGSGELFAYVGAVSDGLRLLAYLSSEKDEPPPAFSKRANSVGILVDKKGKLRVYEGSGIWLPVHGKFHAWGSGAHFAIGAMEVGATAEQAVRVSMKWDTGTGGAVRLMPLKEAS